LTIIFSIIFIFTIILGIVYNLLGYKPFRISYIISIGFTLLSYLFSFFAFRQPQIFDEKYKDIRYEFDLLPPKKVEIKYEKSGLKNDDAQKHLERLVNYVEYEKPFLNGDLTIQDLSDKLDIPKHHLTQIINEKLKKNFYTFINEYRVKHFKSLLHNSSFQNYTLLALAYESGFNSKSSFNVIFKKITGLTPSQFKKEQDTIHN
jgi:AraC-like DNA-binding protein